MDSAAPARISYRRRQPEHTALYQIMRDRWPGVRAMCREAGDGQGLPAFIDRAFERYLSCGRLEKGLVRVYCQKCRKSESLP